MNKKTNVLLLGDIIAVAVITAYGFLFHGELTTVSPYRILATFIPVLISWVLIAPWLGLYRPEIYTDWRQLWRTGWAVTLAAPIATFFRSLMLGNIPILPIFIAVVAATSALGMLIWRGIWWLIARQKN
ncbi:MAG: DUF3054 domain-containing protein [Anaerolineae bacterium]|jgi:hypothetical protein|nr:DUF3054 domain-containing protein [Anaerolineae bacterium]MBT4309357.1 DUF3054 domain-containing protein [Anaerolineae bacterium]MBT4458120.1 DUF3054 domain-containing protein [Anaerolineae bacterium]MBT4841044.1 DUF3054 domain-containing protein [Anaerolineae bacterium]MBT6062991.1 DUF3054 domain-containing protein [Anaerolineae bacterium]